MNILVDDVDKDLLQKRWSPQRTKSGAIYAFRVIPQKEYLHLVVARRMGIVSPGHEVDHRDGNTLNNSRSNLRRATVAQNRRNTRRRKDNTSAYKGVSFNKRRNAWVATIKVPRQLFLGYFDNILEAAITYDRAAFKYHGEFCRSNYPAFACGAE